VARGQAYVSQPGFYPAILLSDQGQPHLLKLDGLPDFQMVMLSGDTLSFTQETGGLFLSSRVRWRQARERVTELNNFVWSMRSAPRRASWSTCSASVSRCHSRRTIPSALGFAGGKQ